ncbi:MAG: exodeoxyribonuclease VII large subunit, partial [Azospirillum sp.]|nr:exodeoxyribonuclease VII large subunit [Azospirillum sp.]
MKIHFDLPFGDKDAMKAMGGTWDPAFVRPNGKTGAWYLRAGAPNLEKAKMRWRPFDATHATVAPGPFAPTAVAPTFGEPISDASASRAADRNGPGIGANAAESLSAFMGRIGGTIAQAFADRYWIRAELSEIKTASNGHVYMTLVETANGAQIARAQAMVWSREATACFAPIVAALGGMPSVGMTLMVKAKPVFSEKFGFSLNILEIDPAATLGAMELALRRLRTKLKETGQYDANRDKIGRA